MNKKIFLNICICTTKFPLFLQIVDGRGCVICKKTITNGYDNICLSVCDSKIYFVAKYQNQTMIKFVRLQNFQKQKLFLCFNSFVQTIQNQSFLLIDYNYGFPIKNAILSFNKKGE